MDAASLGSTGLSVSAVGFGTARFAESFYDATRGEMVRLLREAYDRGITYFDTSDMYSQGPCETLLGDAFGSGPSDVVICSKVGYVVTSRAASVARLESLAVPVLKRLRVPRPERGGGPDGGPAATPASVRPAGSGGVRRRPRTRRSATSNRS